MHLPAKYSDPLTSHLAAEYVFSSGLRARQQHQVLAAVRAFPGRTAYELSVASGLCRWQIGRRLSELEARKLVASSGKDAKVTCSVTGRKAMTWEPVQLELVS